MGAVVHVPLHAEQVISHTRSAFLESIASLQGSDGGLIADSKVHDILNKIHDILDNAISKWVGNAGYILAYLFNSASRQHC